MPLLRKQLRGSFLVELKRAKVPNQELVEFYVTCIQSVLTYACQVYHYALPEYLSLLLDIIQKRAMCVIYGYDVSYKDALTNSGLSNLYQRRSELCRNFFNKLLMNSVDKLHALLPFNVSQSSVTLHKNRTFTIPRCKTNRFRDSFINGSARHYNSMN
jgi:hypothetical protein